MICWVILKGCALVMCEQDDYELIEKMTDEESWVNSHEGFTATS